MDKKNKTIEYLSKLNPGLQVYYLELLIKRDQNFLTGLNIYIQKNKEEEINAFYSIDFDLKELHERDTFFNLLNEDDHLFITYKQNILFLNISRFSKEILIELLKSVFFITPTYFINEKSAFKNINITNTKKRDTKVYIRALKFLYPHLIQEPSLYIKKVIKLIDKSNSLYKKALKVFEEDKVLINDVIYYDKDGGYHTYSKKDVKLEYLNYILNKCSKYNNIKYDIEKLFEYKILIPLFYNIKRNYSFIYPEENIFDYKNGLKEVISITKDTTSRQIVLDNIVIFKNITENDLKGDDILPGVTKKNIYIPGKDNKDVCHFSNFYWDVYIGKESNKLYYCYVVPNFLKS